MDFTYPDDVLEVRRVARDFAEKEIRPHVMEWDEAQTFPREILLKLGELGFLGILIPQAYDGAGLGYLEYVTIIEELSRVDGSVGISVAAHNSLCTGHIFTFGTEEQRRKFVVPLAKGEKLGAWSLTEPEAGSDAGGTQTTARLDGDHWILNGQKTFTTHGTYGDICVAMAVTDKSAGHHGISAFIVEKGTPGFTAGKKENKLGLRASDTSTVLFDDCRIPKDNLLGQAGPRFHRRADRSRRRPYQHRRTGPGHGPRRIRSSSPLLAAAKAIRQNDLGFSGNPIQACRYGHGD